MNTINIIGTDKKDRHLLIANADKNLPSMRNVGYNTYSFNKEVSFVFKDIPLGELDEYGNHPESRYVRYKPQLIKVMQPNGKFSIGQTCAIFDKEKNEWFKYEIDFS